MTYYSGVMPPSLTPASAFMDVLDAALLAEGFTLEAELGPGEIGSTSSARANVYKSSQALNGVMDWYLVVRRATDYAATGSIAVLVAEAFDGTSITSYPPTSMNLTPQADTYLYAGAPVDLATTTSGAFLTAPNVARTGTQYVFSITPHRLILNTRSHANSSSDDTMYAGLFDNMVYGWTGPNVGIFRVAPGGASSSTYGALTREPFQTAASSYNFFVYMTYAARFGAGEASSGPDAYAGVSFLSKALIYSTRSPAGSPRGVLKDLYVTGSGNSTLPGTTGALAGDEVELHDMWGNSQTLVALTSQYATGWWMKKV